MPFIRTGKVLVIHHDHVLENIPLLKVFSPWDLNYQQTISSVSKRKAKQTKKPHPNPSPTNCPENLKNLWHQIYHKQNIDF